MLGDRLRRLREQRDLNQKDVAEALNITATTLSRYEAGIRSPDSEALVRLAEFYGVSIDYLLGRKNPSSPIAEDDEEWLSLLQKAREKGIELEATALLRTSGRLSKAQLRDILRVFEMIETEQQE